MRIRIAGGIFVVVGCVTLLLLGHGLFQDRRNGPDASENSANGTERPGTAWSSPVQAAARGLPPSQEQLWSRPVTEQTFAPFVDWTRRYAAAPTPAARLNLETEGVTLARARLVAMADMVQSNPERALELAVPHPVRVQLPDSIRALIEAPVNTTGDYSVVCVMPAPGEKSMTPFIRSASIQGVVHQVFTHGPGLDYVTRKNVPLNGISVPMTEATSPPSDLIGLHPTRLMALDPSPARLLDESERAERAPGAAVAVEWAGAVRSFDTLGAAQLWVASETGGASLDSPHIPANLPTAESSYTEGRKRYLLMRVDFPDYTNDVFPTNNALQHMVDMSNFLAQISYFKHVIAPVGKGSDITPIMRMGEVASAYDNQGLSKLYPEARTVAQNVYGYDLTRYDFFFVCTGGRPAYGYAGIGYVGGVGYHLANGYFDVRTSAHELGHNLGLGHANWRDTGDRSTIGAGTNEEYGDPFDTMGDSGGGIRHFSASFKSRLDWIPSSQAITVTTSGVHRLYAHDIASAPVGLRALRLNRASGDPYWIEFRQLWTGNKPLMNGINFRLAAGASQLLDMTPGSSGGKNDHSLVIGRTFSDWSQNFHVTPMRKANTYPESIDVAIRFGPFPTNQAPSVIASASTLAALPGQAITLAALATDPNGDALAYAWDFGDGDYSVDNPAQTTHSFAGAGEYYVEVTVSDMKGGVGRDAVIITVGTPATFAISGRVLNHIGAPLTGIRVSAGSTRYAFTESDGSYTITRLTAGVYTLTAIDPVTDAYTFATPFFSNPLTVGPDFATADFVVSTPGAGGYNITYVSSPAYDEILLSPTNVTINAFAQSTADTASRVDFHADGVKIGEDSTTPFSAVWANPGNGTHALRVVAVFGGTSITSQPVRITVALPAPPPALLTLIATNSSWHWLLTNFAATAGWQSPAYDDSAWSSGAAKLGFSANNAGINTILYGGPDTARYPAGYFRQAFNLNDPASVTNLNLLLYRDDGAVVYLNGTEVLRDNMTNGVPVVYSSLATNAADNGNTPYSFSLPVSGLRHGTNVVAVEVHQSSATSSNLVFDLGLSALVRTNRARGCWLVSPAEGATIPLPSSDMLTAEAVAGGTLGLPKVEFFSDIIKIGEAFAAPFTLAWNSVPAGAHALRAVATDTAGGSVTSAPVNVIVLAPPLGKALISFGDMWKYMDDGSDQGTNWIRGTFDDRGWAMGPARLGYSGDGELTTVSYGTDPNNKHITTYFRHAFTVANPASFSGLLLRLIRDDGAVVCLNGVEVLRDNLLPGLVSWNSLAVATINPPDEATPVNVNLTTTGLVAGTNMIAVEVHQAAVNSSGLGFDLALIGLVSTNTAQGIYLTSPADGAHYNSPAAVGLSAFAAAPNPVTLVEYFDGAAKIGQSAAIPYSLTWNNPSIGAHSLTARATCGAGLLLTSPPVSVVVGYPPAPVLPVFDTLIQAGSTWKYWDNVTAVGAGWQGTGFDDRAWPGALARFGCGLDGEATLLTQGRTTVYFRRWMTVTNASVLSELIFRLQRDDGAVVYLNGAEVYRSNMSGGAVNAGTVASTTVNTPEETLFFETVVSVGALNLITGSNLVAVELHQASPTSSDAGFDLQLIASGTTEPRVYFSAPADGSIHTISSTISFDGNAFAGTGYSVSKVELFANSIKLGETSVLPFHFTWPMPGPGPHTMVARMTDNRGAPVDSSPLIINVVRQGFTNNLIASNSVWKYLDNGSNQGTNWAQLNFTDAAWASGPARLGYGKDGETTTISFGRNPDAKYSTTYFRKSFVVPPGAVYTNLLFKLARDDGAVIYLNGREAYRNNMPAGPITYASFANSGAADEQTFFPTNIAVSNLPSGTNVVAAEIHQSKPDSGDLGFNLELTGSGYLDDTSPPMVCVVMADRMIEISWPSTYTSWRVYTSLSVTAPANTWTPLTATPVTASGRIVVTLQPSLETQFFRLGRP